MVFGTSNNKTYDKTKSLFEQFTYREDYDFNWNMFVKCFVRPKLIENVQTVHMTFNKNYKVKNPHML